MLLGITGKKGSGKDALGHGMNWPIVKMADTLKNMLRTMYADAGLEPEDIERKIEGDLKNEPCEVLGGATPRWAMQTLGTEWAKMVDPTHTLWSRIWEGKVAPMLMDGIPVACTDIRFQHEAEAVRRLGGYLVRVYRPGLPDSDNHASETEMENIVVDKTVINDGTLLELLDQSATIRKDLMK